MITTAYLHLRRAKDLIDREYGRELDLRALAREAHASRAHFVRSFKKAFGETPHQYLLQRRIERAKELLRSTGMSVTEVSIEVGFRSLGSFSAAFRTLVGESPSDYAKRWRAAGAPPIPACFMLMHTRPHRALFEKHGGDSTHSLPPAPQRRKERDDHGTVPHDDLGSRPG